MKFDKRHKIDRAAARDDTRYMINAAMFERDENGARLITTNGRILAVVPVTDADGDAPGLVSTDTIKAACRNRTNASPDATIMLPDEKRALALTRAGTVEGPRPERANFPDYKAVVPKPDDGLEITLGAEQLLSLIDALGVRGADMDGITLKVTATRDEGGVITGIDDSLSILVEPIAGGNDAFGVIMPISGT